MGQKVSPIGLRVGVIRDWESRWYADKDYADLLLEDVKIREFLFAECKNASVSRVEIERSKNRVEIMIRTARPGVIIGTNGENVEMLKKKVEKLTGGKNIYLRFWNCKPGSGRKTGCPQHCGSAGAACFLPYCTEESNPENDACRCKRY